MGKFIVSFRRQGTITPGQPSTPSVSDLVELGILPKQVSEFTTADIGTEISIPYNDESGKFLLNNGCIEFEVVGVNHHTSDEHPTTITLMTKNIIRYAAFDAREPNSPTYDNRYEEYLRRAVGNNSWSVSNIRQWLNSSGAGGSWFTAQYEYDAAPIASNLKDGNTDGAYADEPGFLAGFSADVLQHFTDITNITAKSELDGSGSEETVDKVFLPSYTEMFGENNSGISEGSYLSLRYTDDNSRKKTGANSWYWMRSPSLGTFYYSTRLISSYGYEDRPEGPCDGNGGIAPIIVLH